LGAKPIPTLDFGRFPPDRAQFSGRATMKLQFHVRSILSIGFALLFIGSMPLTQKTLCRAESVRHEAKRIHKIEKTLAKYPPKTYLRLVMVDHSQVLGTVGELGASSFTFTSADSNATQRFAYADVASVDRGETYIGEGSAHRHLPRLVIAGIASAVAAGAIAAFTVTQ
jgi:hypothetical protein